MKPRRKSMEYERADRNNRYKVFIRDEGKCVLCNEVGVDIHEIIPRSELGDIEKLFDVRNRVLLCRACHTNKADRKTLILLMKKLHDYDYSENPWKIYLGDNEQNDR